MSRLVILAVALASLATIELRRTSQGHQVALAKANARLALMQAIGQLQKTLGPDQRVSASADILEGHPQQPQWTGVWRTTRDDGTSLFTRDDLAGGLSDARWTLESTPAERVLEWLVSGTGDPMASAGTDPVILAHGGLKRDLTAGTGDVPSWKNLSGLAGNDSLVGDPPDANSTASRYRADGVTPRRPLQVAMLREPVPHDSPPPASEK